MLFSRHPYVLAGMAICMLLLASCETDRNEVMAMGEKKIMPSQTGKDITMLYTDSTLLKVRLEAPQMIMYDKGTKEPMTIMPKGLFVSFFDDKGKQSTT